MSTAGDKEAWMDQVMESIRGVQPVQPSDDLYEKIIKKLSNAPVARQWSSNIISILLNGTRSVNNDAF